MIEELSPVPDDVTQPWWDATRDRRLLLQRCTDCSHTQHYPRAVCTSCGAFSLDWIDATGRGWVDSFTVVHRAPHPALDTPYVIARVKLEEGPTILTRIVDTPESELRCDVPVRLQWTEIPGGYQLPVFRIDNQ